MKSIKALLLPIFALLAFLVGWYVYEVLNATKETAKCQKLSDEVEKSRCMDRVAKEASSWTWPGLSKSGTSEEE